MKKILTFLILILTISLSKAQKPNPEIWTKSEEKAVYDSFYSVANSIFTSGEQKADYAKYCLKHVEERFPNGVESVSDDSLKKVMYLIGESYTRQTKTFQLQAWTPQYEKLIKGYLLQNPSLSSLNEQKRNAFCDCDIYNLKKIYPNGVSQRVPKETQNSISKTCLGELK
jgi:hypothetical protein